MKIEIRNNGIRDIIVLLAEEGKVFKRKNSNDVYGNELYLGTSYYMNGVRLDTPHKDIPEDFEEIDAPVEETEEQEEIYE